LSAGACIVHFDIGIPARETLLPRLTSLRCHCQLLVAWPVPCLPAKALTRWGGSEERKGRELGMWEVEDADRKRANWWSVVTTAVEMKVVDLREWRSLPPQQALLP